MFSNFIFQTASYPVLSFVKLVAKCPVSGSINRRNVQRENEIVSSWDTEPGSSKSSEYTGQNQVTWLMLILSLVKYVELTFDQFSGGLFLSLGGLVIS